MARRQTPPKNKKKDMAKRKGLESENPFTNLLNSLKEGKLGHNQIQIAYRAWIKEGKEVPDAVKDLLAGSGNNSGLLFGMFMSIRAIVVNMELAYRRGYGKGYEDGRKVIRNKKKVVYKKVVKIRRKLRRARQY